MTPLAIIMLVLSSLLQVYVILLFLRIFLSWVQIRGSNPAVALLFRITDPYLNWFRRFTWLRLGPIDLSPALAIGLVVFVMYITNVLLAQGMITGGFVLALLVRLVMSTITFTFFLVAVVCLVRILSLFFSMGSAPFWAFLDQLLQTPVAKLSRLIARNRILRYRTGLLLLGSLCAVIGAAGSVGMGFLTAALEALPF